jgi:glycosyltransferase involved in cell wall biosynthesis
MLDRITFGITSFERPRLLEQLVASIRVRYPQARILVADNGRQKANLPGDVKVLNLEFDCGLSRARNALIDNLQTEFLLLLEEDFLFTDETRIEPFVEILDTDHEVGMIGGAVRGATGRLGLYCLDIDVFRDVMYVQDATRRMRMTGNGTGYRVCDIAWNFGLFRRSFLDMHRWDDRLKVGEHAAYFHQVKLRGHWRVAATPAVALYHVPDRRSEHYVKHRRRAKDYLQQYLEWNGLKDYRRVPPLLFHDDQFGKPNVVVLGVGHSGTTILTRMLHAAGWNTPDADEEFEECVWMREMNLELIHLGRFNASHAMRRVKELPQPWAVKDPRFVSTLNVWTPLFAELENPPALVRVVRNSDDVKRSYLRRGFRGNIHDIIDLRLRQCEKQYANWPWARLTVQYEQLRTAAGLFTQKGPQVDDVPPIWPPGPDTLGVIPRNGNGRPVKIRGTASPDAQGTRVAARAAISPGWQTSFPVDETIEGMEHQSLDEVVRGDAGRFQPGWQQTIHQNEVIEGVEHHFLDEVAQADEGAVRPGWRQTIQLDETIEGMEHLAVEDRDTISTNLSQQTQPAVSFPDFGDGPKQAAGNGQQTRASGGRTAQRFVPGWKSIIPEDTGDDANPDSAPGS